MAGYGRVGIGPESCGTSRVRNMTLTGTFYQYYSPRSLPYSIRAARPQAEPGSVWYAKRAASFYFTLLVLMGLRLLRRTNKQSKGAS